MKIAITARMRNGVLWEAVEKLGGMKKLAEYLGLPYVETVALVNMKIFPAYRNPKSKRDWKAIEAKLVQLTGLLLEDVFPPEIATREFLARPHVHSVIHDVPVEQLSGIKETLLLGSPTEEADEEIDNDLLKEQFIKLLKELKPQEAQVLTMRFGLDGNGEHTLEEVGKYFNLTGTRIRQIEMRALRRLRHPERAKILKRFINTEKCYRCNGRGQLGLGKFGTWDNKLNKAVFIKRVEICEACGGKGHF